VNKFREQNAGLANAVLSDDGNFDQDRAKVNGRLVSLVVYSQIDAMILN
jgi:hypothetical protein